MLQQAVVVVQKVITLCWLQTYSVPNEPENLVEFKEIRKLWSSVFLVQNSQITVSTPMAISR